MKYASQEKNWKYHVKSWLVTFGSIFGGLLTFQFLSYDFKSFDPSLLSGELILSALFSFLRTAVVLALIAAQSTLKK